MNEGYHITSSFPLLRDNAPPLCVLPSSTKRLQGEGSKGSPAPGALMAPRRMSSSTRKPKVKPTNILSGTCQLTLWNRYGPTCLLPLLFRPLMQLAISPAITLATNEWWLRYTLTMPQKYLPTTPLSDDLLALHATATDATQDDHEPLRR